MAVFPLLLVALLAGDGTPSTFYRFRDLGGWEAVAETAVVTYRDARGAEVALVAADHYADRAYYAEVQAILETFDAVLVEGFRPGSARSRGHEVHVRPAGAQVGDRPIDLMFVAAERAERFLFVRVLGLACQWDAIDCRRPGFAAVDLEMADYERRVRATGELRADLDTYSALYGNYLRRVVRRLTAARPSAGGAVGFVRAVLAGGPRRILEYLILREDDEVARSFPERVPAGAFAVTTDARNRSVVEDLKERIGSGRRRLAVFYGVGHMPGIERALIGELGFRKAEERWLVSWDLRRPASKRKLPGGRTSRERFFRTRDR